MMVFYIYIYIYLLRTREIVKVKISFVAAAAAARPPSMCALCSSAREHTKRVWILNVLI